MTNQHNEERRPYKPDPAIRCRNVRSLTPEEIVAMQPAHQGEKMPCCGEWWHEPEYVRHVRKHHRQTAPMVYRWLCAANKMT